MKISTFLDVYTRKKYLFCNICCCIDTLISSREYNYQRFHYKLEATCRRKYHLTVLNKDIFVFSSLLKFANGTLKIERLSKNKQVELNQRTVYNVITTFLECHLLSSR